MPTEPAAYFAQQLGLGASRKLVGFRQQHEQPSFTEPVDELQIECCQGMPGIH